MYQYNPLLIEGKIGKLLSGSGVNNMAGKWKVKSARKAAAKALKDARRGIEHIEAGPFSYSVKHGALKGSNKARRIQDTIYHNLLGDTSHRIRPDLTKVM